MPGEQEWEPLAFPLGKRSAGRLPSLCLPACFPFVPLGLQQRAHRQFPLHLLLTFLRVSPFIGHRPGHGSSPVDCMSILDATNCGVAGPWAAGSSRICQFGLEAPKMGVWVEQEMVGIFDTVPLLWAPKTPPVTRTTPFTQYHQCLVACSTPLHPMLSSNNHVCLAHRFVLSTEYNAGHKVSVQ